jgi:hypothetical protein
MKGRKLLKQKITILVLVSSMREGSGKIFCSRRRPDRLRGQTSLLLNWYELFLLGRIEQPGRETNHSPLTNAQVKNAWIYTSILPYGFMA